MEKEVRTVKTAAKSTKQISNPGKNLLYPVFEYLLVLRPHEDLWNKLLKLKDSFAIQYQAQQARHSKPHITLVKFSQYEMMEDRFVNRLKMIAMGYPPVKIELADFGSLPSHSIYINVTSKIPIQNLVRQIRSETQRLMKMNDDHKPYFMMEPHLIIAQKLQPWQYEKAWSLYSNKHFTGRFIATNMLLLKRAAGDLKYEIVKRFEFENLPVNTKQGELFS